MRSTLCLSFDNLGEAAELELGAISPDAPLGDHFTATRVVPSILEALAARGLAATFFVEGLNAEVYPDLLREIAAGHEVAYHAWRHEQWGDLTTAEQAGNLARSLAAFETAGLEISGMRPPGGGLGAGGLDVLRDAGLAYCSPAGAGAGADRDDLALLPFQWRHVDASCVLPPLAAVREQMIGSAEPLGPDRFLAFLETRDRRPRRARRLRDDRPPPVHARRWFGRERLDTLLDRVATASSAGELRVAPCRDVAAEVLADPAAFAGGAILDSTSWSG